MKSIYRNIISNGTTGAWDDSGENAKGENLGLIAGAELYQMVELFPEMLEMLKEINDNDDVYYKIKSVGARARLRKVIAEAEGGEWCN